MESLNVPAKTIKAALSNIFHIKTESDGSLNQQTLYRHFLLLCETKRLSYRDRINCSPLTHYLIIEFALIAFQHFFGHYIFNIMKIWTISVLPVHLLMCILIQHWEINVSNYLIQSQEYTNYTYLL